MTHTTDLSLRQSTGCLRLLLIIAALIWILRQPELLQGDDERS